MFDEIVTVRSRTGEPAEFMYDSIPYTIEVKKGMRVPRAMADMAVKQNALRWDSSTGLVVEATVYVEEDLETERALPSGKLDKKEIEAIKSTDGLGNDFILVNGQPRRKTTIDFKNKYAKEDFTKNNVVG